MQDTLGLWKSFRSHGNRSLKKMAEDKKEKEPLYTLESARKSLPYTGYGIHQKLVRVYQQILKDAGSLNVDPKKIDSFNKLLAEEAEKALLNEIGIQGLGKPAKGSEAMAEFVRKALKVSEVPKLNKSGYLPDVYMQIGNFTESYRQQVRTSMIREMPEGDKKSLAGEIEKYGSFKLRDGVMSDPGALAAAWNTFDQIKQSEGKDDEKKFALRKNLEKLIKEEEEREAARKDA